MKNFPNFFNYFINVFLFILGFSTADHTWLPVASNYRTLNALAQLRAPKSHLQMFMKLIRLRQLRSFQDGELKIKAIGDDIIIYSRCVCKYTVLLPHTHTPNYFISPLAIHT